MLSKDAIFQAGSSIPTERVEVPEWGGHVFVRAMTAAQVDEFGAMAQAKGTKKNLTALLVAWTIVNEQGQRVFDDHDAEKLGGFPYTVLDRLAKVALSLSGLANGVLEGVAEAQGN